MKLECYHGVFSYFTSCVPWGRACTSPMHLSIVFNFSSDDCIIPNTKQKQKLCNFFVYYGKSGADPGLFLGGGALVSCSTSTPINHILFFFAEYQLY